MKYNFIYKNKCWWLKITSIEELISYWENTDSKWADVFTNITNSKEYGCGMEHIDAVGLSVALSGANKHQNPISAIMDFRGNLFQTQLEYLQQYKELYINKNGGYHFKYNNDKIEQFITKDKFIFPSFKKEEIRIKKFPLGNHYYAYIGDMQLRNGEQLKWNTYKEAFDFANNYIAN